MKKIEEIEKLDFEDLQKAAQDSSITVPDGLQDRLEQVIDAKLLMEAGALDGIPSLRSRIAAGVLGVAAACIATFFFLRYPQKPNLKDTFDDPYLAYAEVEKAFSRISDEMSKAAGKSFQAARIIEKPKETIRKINEK